MKQHTYRLRSVAWGAVLSTLVAALPAWAVEPFAVRDIRVEGLQRVEAGTIFASLPLRVGDTYNDDKGASAIRSLFGLGLFSDVRLQVEGDVLASYNQQLLNHNQYFLKRLTPLLVLKNYQFLKIGF